VGVLKQVRDVLHEPRLKDVDVDSDQLLVIHRAILQEKPMMNEVFKEFYDLCIDLDNQYFSGSGKRVEIGAGVSFFKKLYPEIVSTDIKRADNLDMVLDAQNMDLPDGSVRALYGLNCFHHFPEPCKFFNELKRVLNPGGGCVLIEPYFGFVAERFYKNVHEVETFDGNQKEWENNALGFSSNANQALSYIVFVRDRTKFDKLYPELEIVVQKPIHNYLRYLLCGGLNFRQVLPSWTSPVIKVVEALMIPVSKIFALHHVVVIRKRG
jgi:SAM-dependent methyltransferase